MNSEHFGIFSCMHCSRPSPKWIVNTFVGKQRHTMVSRCSCRSTLACRTTTTTCQFQLNYRCTYAANIALRPPLHCLGRMCVVYASHRMSATFWMEQLGFLLFVGNVRESESANKQKHRTTHRNIFNKIEIRFLFRRRSPINEQPILK